MKYCSATCQKGAAKRSGGVAVGPFLVLSVCVACGGPIERGKKAGVKYCSDECGARFYASPSRFLERFGRTCERCGTSIPDEARLNRRYCSTTCQVRTCVEARRIRRLGLPAVNISRVEIFARDDMTCHLCGTAILDHPTLDHIIPVSHPLCPGHIPANVAAAHLRCNQSKGCRVRPEDWSLFHRLSGVLAPI